MFQPSTPEPRSEAVKPGPDHETVIRFVISGPYLNAEARTGAEQPADADLQMLLDRIGELELKLRDERARVDELCRALSAATPAAPQAAAPDPEPEPEPLPRPVALPSFTLAAAAGPAPAPVAAPPVAPPLSVAPVVERARAHTHPDAPPEPVAPPKLHALSTAAPPPPPKVRGLRRMIGALRHL